MNVGIIGAGNVGRALAGSLTRGGHTVVISSSKTEDANAAAAATGARAATSNPEVAQAADVVILAVGFGAIEGLAAELRSDLDGKTVVDVTNVPSPDPSNPSPDARSAAERIQALLPGSHVVKAFNTAFAVRQADPVVDGVQLDGFVAGEDGDAKAAVLELVESVGFRPIDVGPLPMARTLEAMGWLNIQLQIRNGWPWQGGWKFAGPSAASTPAVSAARR
jgi:8-hydroxy-5-deazaflavin:NADPH oxidoreductase